MSKVQSTSRAKSVLRTTLPLALGILMLWLLYRNTEWSDIKKILESDLNYGMLAFSLVFGLLANVVRGLRWQLLIPPIVPKGEDEPRLVNAILTVLGSYTINMGIPRAGELWRCAEYRRYESLSFTALLGTLINDRLADVLSLLLILLGVLLSYRNFFLGFFADNPQQVERLQSVLYSPYLYALLGLGLVLFIALVYFLRKRPDNKLSQFIISIVSGVASIRSMKHRGRFIIYSLMIWGGYFLFFYTTFFAFPFTRTLDVEVALIAFALSSMSVLAPVQAGMGPWHFMVITTLTAYGISRSDAGAFALIVHSTQTLWISLVGLVAIIALPFVNKHYRRRQIERDISA